MLKQLASKEKTYQQKAAAKVRVSPGKSLSELKQFQINLDQVLNKLLYFLCAFLLSRFLIIGEVGIIGEAFFLANKNRQKAIRWMILAGVFGGIFSIKGLWESLITVAILGLVVLINNTNLWRLKTKFRQPVFYLSWIMLKVGTSFLPIIKNISTFNLFIEILLGIAVALIFEKVREALKNPFKYNNKVSQFGILLLVFFALGGTFGLTVHEVAIIDIGMLLLILVAGYLGGGRVGGVVGIVGALVVGIFNHNIIMAIALFGTAGLLGGFFRFWGKSGVAVASSFGLIMIMYLARIELTTAPIWHPVPWLLGIVIFFLLPKRMLARFSLYFPNELKNYHFAEVQKRLRELFLARLHNMSDIFSELAKSFTQNAAVKQNSPSTRMDLYSLLDKICAINCRQCIGYDNCWGEHFYMTYRELFDLISLAELYGQVNINQIKGRLAQSCFKHYKLIATINDLFEKYQTNYYWQKKLDESKGFAKNQLKGIAMVIRNLANEISTDVAFKLEAEERLRYNLKVSGINLEDLSIMSYGKPNQFEVKITQKPCSRGRICHCVASPLVSGILRQRYMVWERQCEAENGFCTYYLVPARQFEIRTASYKIAKDGNEGSGDNYNLRELKNGYFIGILSDGMGHGSKASQESNITVSILERFLESGIDREFAVKMLNSILLVHSPEESFATVDLALINLFNAKAEFIKIGAATTYIKRVNEVIEVKSTSLPAGILNSIEAESTVFNLQNRDYIIMISDGVLDQKEEDLKNDQEWIKEALKEIDVMSPESLGEHLLNLALKRQGGSPKDDLSIIVLQIMKKW